MKTLGIMHYAESTEQPQKQQTDLKGLNHRHSSGTEDLEAVFPKQQ